MEAAIYGLIGTLIGASTSIWMAYINNNKAQIDLENLRKENESKGFHKKNFIEIQENLYTAIRTNALMLLEDEKSFNETGIWQKT
tara:strand:- start:312 stop:566 length:255 start_codon:yes stop_codon:yes gene_type:complete